MNSATSPKKSFLEVSIEAPSESVDSIADFLIENITGGNGIVLEDNDDSTIIKLYLRSDRDPENQLIRIRDFLAESWSLPGEDNARSVTTKEIDEIDWVQEYQRKFEPVTVDDIVVKSSWSDEVYPGKLVLTIEPKMAFGTGKHETTQLCIAAVRNCVHGGENILDLGTGSGVLAILAVKLGADHVFGLDIDPNAVENAAENALLNEVADKIDVAEGSMDKIEGTDIYDMVISNLIMEGIVELFDDFHRVLKPGGKMILSGILTQQVEELNEFLSQRNIKDYRITTLNEWACYELKSLR